MCIAINYADKISFSVAIKNEGPILTYFLLEIIFSRGYWFKNWMSRNILNDWWLETKHAIVHSPHLSFLVHKTKEGDGLTESVYK